MDLTVDYLNHASLLLRMGERRLLCDPWYGGTAFSGGWGLRYENPQALAVACEATHLWISHWHSDHLHVPTLKALAQRRPDLEVLANSSANFSLVERLRGFGFRTVRELGERIPLALGDGVTVTRYPTAGIDNMLHIRAPGWSILNYNDCNLRPVAIRGLRRKIGRIDLLLTNYNHAGKLFAPEAPAIEQQKLWDALMRVVDLLLPRRVLPFASSHYYRVRENQDQNQSLLSFDDLERRAHGDPRFAIVRVGDTVSFAGDTIEPRYVRREPRLLPQPVLAHDYGDSVPWQELLAAATARCEQLRRGFPLGYRAVSPLRIEVSDQGRTLELDLRSEPHAAKAGAAHIAAHSRALHDWLGRRFGDDSFIAGAHFEVRDRDTRTAKLWIALSLLEASQLSVRDAMRYLRTKNGLRFLWARREEILATLTSGPLKAGEMRT